MTFLSLPRTYLLCPAMLGPRGGIHAITHFPCIFAAPAVSWGLTGKEMDEERIFGSWGQTMDK